MEFDREWYQAGGQLSISPATCPDAKLPEKSGTEIAKLTNGPIDSNPNSPRRR